MFSLWHPPSRESKCLHSLLLVFDMDVIMDVEWMGDSRLSEIWYLWYVARDLGMQLGNFIWHTVIWDPWVSVIAYCGLKSLHFHIGPSKNVLYPEFWLFRRMWSIFWSKGPELLPSVLVLTGTGFWPCCHSIAFLFGQFLFDNRMPPSSQWAESIDCGLAGPVT